MDKGYYHKEWYLWRDSVLRFVQFRPDHEAIAKELYQHYEDSVLDFERIGYEEALARERALRAMGDPVEVGKGLNKAHKPWLGWLQKATEWTAFALALVLAVTLLKDWWIVEIYGHVADQAKWQTPPAWAQSVQMEQGTVYMASGKVWEENGLVWQSVDIWLELDAPQTSRPEGLWELAEYTTDQGVIGSQVRDEEGVWTESFYYNYRTDTDFYAMDSYTRYQWSVCFATEDPLEWVEIRYPFQDWVLRAEWEAET